MCIIVILIQRKYLCAAISNFSYEKTIINATQVLKRTKRKMKVMEKNNNNNNKFSSFPFIRNNNTNLDKFANYIYLHHIRMDFVLLVSFSKDLPPLNDSLCILCTVCLFKSSEWQMRTLKTNIPSIFTFNLYSGSSKNKMKLHSHTKNTKIQTHTPKLYLWRGILFFREHETTEVIFIRLLYKFLFYSCHSVPPE